MTHEEKRIYLIRCLLAESDRYSSLTIPSDEHDQKSLLRSLMNIRMPGPVSDDYLEVQDEYLKEAMQEKGVTDIKDLDTAEPGIYLWQGDITALRCDAIVNAANSGMTGCYVPLHNCIDNCIHTYAGVQLRNMCAQIMDEQGFEEPTGQAKLTPAFNLPCRYILHTVGPIVQGRLTKRHEDLLASCYWSCLKLAEDNGITSLAFCCISTGVFGFPRERAARIAVQTVRGHLAETKYDIEVVFNVFKDEDYEIYRELLK